MDDVGEDDIVETKITVPAAVSATYGCTQYSIIKRSMAQEKRAYSKKAPWTFQQAPRLLAGMWPRRPVP